MFRDPPFWRINMTTMTHKLALLVSGLLLFLATGIGAADSATQDEKARVGAPAPAWELVDTRGKSHSLADYKGSIVILEWYNPGCPFSRRIHEDRTIKNLRTSFADLEGKYVYLAVNSTANKPESKVRAESDRFMKKAGVKNLPILMDYSGSVGKAYGAKTTPHMYIIDGKGVLRYEGAITNDQSGKKPDATNYVLQALKQLADGETVAPDATSEWGCGVKYAR